MNGGFGVRLYKQSFNFASAHFLIFGDGRREQLHGHNYRVSIELKGKLSKADLLADFIVLKPLIRQVCDDLDHRVLIPTESDSLEIVKTDKEVEVRVSDGARFVFPLTDVVFVPLANTSTERLAELISSRLQDRITSTIPDIRLDHLRVEVEESGGQCGWYETELSGKMGQVS